MSGCISFDIISASCIRAAMYLASVKHARLAVAFSVFVASWFVGPSQAAALENLKVFRGYLILEGKIEPGDYISVRNFLRDESNFKKISGGVFLASEGGYLNEAIKIGSLIRALRLSTDVPASPPPDARAAGSPAIRGVDLANPRHYQCTSACFLLYVAGIQRNLIWPGRLGIHQPRLEKRPESATDDDVMIASAGARDAIKRYLNNMNVPEKYLDLMYSVPPNEVRWITQEEFDHDLKGYVPEFRTLLDSKCNSRGRAEQVDEHRRCVARATAELSNEAWRKLFRPNPCGETDCRNRLGVSGAPRQ